MASSPSPAEETLYPSPSSSALKTVLSASSSSTTRILFFSAIRILLGRSTDYWPSRTPSVRRSRRNIEKFPKKSNPSSPLPRACPGFEIVASARNASESHCNSQKQLLPLEQNEHASTRKNPTKPSPFFSWTMTLVSHRSSSNS